MEKLKGLDLTIEVVESRYLPSSEGLAALALCCCCNCNTCCCCCCCIAV